MKWPALAGLGCALLLGTGCPRPAAPPCAADADCPAENRCAAGRCLPHSCAGLICAEGAVCLEDLCRPVACLNRACPDETVCAGGECVAQRCGVALCPQQMHCAEGRCADALCAGVSCKQGTRCMRGACLGCDPASGACGQCADGCRAPANAPHACGSEGCGRGACFPGFHDLDGDETFGCEASCRGRLCLLPGGDEVHLSADPLPESRLLFGELAAAPAQGLSAAHSSTFFHQGSLEGILPRPPDPVEATGARHRHIGGFASADEP